MSLDYELYARSAPTTAQLSAVLSPLGITVAAEKEAGWLLTHADATVWVGGPEWLESENLPDVIRADRSMAQFCINGHAGAEPNAVDVVVRSLAAAMEGAVLLDSEGAVVGSDRPGHSSLAVPGTDPGNRLVALNWFGRVRPDSHPAGALWDVATHALPWAVPRKVKQRRGPAIPASRDGLEKQWAASDEDALVFSANSAMLQGSLVSRQRALQNAQGLWRLGFLLPGGSLQEPAAVEQLSAFFAGVAEASGADYAYVEVQSEVTWRRGEASTRADSKTDPLQIVFDPLGREGLWGLPPKPVWWSWFGAEYQRLAAGWLAKPRRGWRLTKTGEGMLLSLGDSPLTAAELRSRGHGSSGWTPDELVVRRRILRGGYLPAHRRLGRWSEGG